MGRHAALHRPGQWSQAHRRRLRALDELRERGIAVLAVQGQDPNATDPGESATFALQPNYRSLQSVTTIAYEMASAGPVRLRVFDLRGRLVRTLVNES